MTEILPKVGTIEWLNQGNVIYKHVKFEYDSQMEADNGVIFPWHFSKVSINDLFEKTVRKQDIPLCPGMWECVGYTSKIEAHSKIT